MYVCIEQFWRSLRRGLPLVLALSLSGSAWAQDEKDEKGDDPKEEPDGEGPKRIRPLQPGPGGLPMPIRPGGPDEGDEDGGPPPPMPPGGDGGPPSGGPPPPGSVTIPPPSNGGSGTGSVTSKKVPCVEPSTKITMDFVDAPLMDVVKYMAEITCRNFILSDDLKGSVTIISHQQVSVAEAYEAFLSALEVAGYTTVMVGKNTKVVATSKAANTPLRVYEDDDIPGTDNFVTQIIQLDNVLVSDISTIVKELSGSSAKVISYAPTNTLIITDAAYNIRRVYRIAKQLDVEAPKSHITVVPLRYATAADVERILEEVYGVATSSTSGSSSASSSGSTATERAASRRRRREAETTETTAGTGASSTNVGAQGAYISKIISDERTNSLIVMANDEALAKVKELIAQIDIDIDPASRSQIHVIYLEHASAEDVAGVLQSLSQSSSGSGSRSSSSSTSRSRTGSQGGRSGGGGAPGGMPSGGGGGPKLPGGAGTESASGSVVAAFDNGIRVTADENTNSLVLIAAPEDFRILKSVIDRLDIPRRQVFVEAVVVEVGSEDEFDLGIGYHFGKDGDEVAFGYASSQTNASSLSLDAALSGLAAGVFGEAISVAVSDGAGGTTEIDVPAFGIALNALASNSAVNILSDPSLLVVDNEEATITVGRNVPFPVSAGRDNLGNAVISYQREDVGITLQVTPQINEANYVTLEVSLEVAEVEEDSSGLDVTTAGFITSNRQTENVVVVKDNQTIVIGGLIGNTQTRVETKVPILGDIPLIGMLFRGKRDTERKTNLLIFLTPHVINEPADLEEVYRIKWAQREEFLRRFYGKSREKQEEEMHALLRGSLNFIDEPSPYRTKVAPKDLVPEPIPAPTPEPPDTSVPTLPEQ